MLPTYNSLKEKNPYLEILNFHTPDNVTLLRMSQPISYGDDLSEIRPIVVNTNKNKVNNSGIEIGKKKGSITE